MSDCYTANWSNNHKGKLVITENAGRQVDSFEISSDGEQPPEGLFAGAEWAPYPGQEWEEEPSGYWSIAVFHDDMLSGGSE